MNSIDKNQPLVSILINNYNYERYVGMAIDSVLQQTYKNIEVIVVDDGSTDNSRDVINRYGDQIVAVFKKNGGQASAMNAGFAASKGEIICLLDADDLFLPEKVAEVVDLFELHSDINWVFTESAPIETEDLIDTNLKALFKDILSNSPEESPRKVDFREGIKNAKLPNFAPSTSNLCFSRAILEKVFPLPEVKGYSGMAITDLYIKLIAIGLSVGCVTVKNLGVYRFHNNFYKTLDLSKKRRMFAEIYITTGYWMKENFPELSKMSKKILSKGFGTYLSSDYLRGQSTDADCEQMMKDYLTDLSPGERLEIRLMVFYYLLRLRFKNFV